VHKVVQKSIVEDLKEVIKALQ